MFNIETGCVAEGGSGVAVSQNSSSGGGNSRMEKVAYERTRLIADVISAIEWALEEQRLSRSELARAMSVSPGRVTQILSGNENPTLSTLASVAIAVNGRFRVHLEMGENPLPAVDGDAPPPRVPAASVVADKPSQGLASRDVVHVSSSASRVLPVSGSCEPSPATGLWRSLISLMRLGRLSCKRVSRSPIAASLPS